jgi:hypothetical protein
MIRIKYADGDYDCVADFMLETLISSNRIEAFYRRSEDRWVVVGDDPMRGMGFKHRGRERRKKVDRYTLA